MEIKIDHSKSIRKLESNAKKGNFYSAFQLYEYYSEGKFVKKDSVKADYFLEMSNSLFEQQEVKIKEINIENFRNFDSLFLSDFDPNINVIVGTNGAGKTTLLDAIDTSLSWLRNSILKTGGSGNYISEKDINLYSDIPYATISSVIEVNHKIDVPLEISKSREGTAKRRNQLLAHRTIGEFYKIANEKNPTFNFPLLAYYNVMRSYDVNPRDISGHDEVIGFDKFEGYRNSLNGKTDFQSFFNWYKRLDDILARRESNVSKATVLKELGLTPSLFEKLEILAEHDEETRESLEVIRSKFPDEVDDILDEDYAKQAKLMVNQAISSFMTGYSNLEVQLEPFVDLLIEKNGRKISVLSLSQGEKTLLTLIADLTKRLIQLNPSLENPLQGQGVILIDEVDLHLHPKWQRKIANNLKKTFPNCQFFLTTHSPLVLGEVNPSQITLLSLDENCSVTIRKPSQSFGLTSNDILNELMSDGASEYTQLGRSELVESMLRQINKLIAIESEDSLAEAREKIIELEELTFGEIPELLGAKMELEILSNHDELTGEDNETDH
ncbi:AAA family ATPase [Vibrio sp. 16]|uniref:AAA family ATPase n=1 Tax=Vibrio sp. 16 TaxID=391586 RepID=UPI0003022700|nr:AAA family ATPase [Vibrio sp. 16]CAK4075902.1 DNA replication and repair protein RecF [Vibrio sp. 16]